MTWILPGNYPKNKVDSAGEILSKKITLKDSKKQREFIDVFHNWRSSHAYPMHIIMMSLKKLAKEIEENALCVQRLKRVSSTIYKLRRFTMTLSQMQDLAGCRVVMPNVNLARKLSEEYISRKKRHKRIKKREKNYINSPKDDGYRSIHLVYEYYSTNEGKAIFNEKMVEIQIRSKLQHLWATAVETVDLFETDKIKFGGGNKKWKRFFTLISSAFAMIENCPPVPNTPTNKRELYSEIVKLEKELKVSEHMVGWAHSLNYLKSKDGKYFILILDIRKKQISAISFRKNEKNFSKFLGKYSKLEEEHSNEEDYDVVLIGADNINEVSKAYPNYFADTNEFLKHLYDIKIKFNPQHSK